MINNNWTFGNGIGLNFNNGAPTLFNTSIDTIEGCASISDSSGNLIFYTDGRTVWGSNHLPVPNGTGLLGNSTATSSAIIVPDPGNPNRYYIFTVDEQDEPGGIHYSIFDRTLNSELGDIVDSPLQSNQLKGHTSEKILAVAKEDCKSYWIIGTGSHNKEMYVTELTASGLSSVNVQTVAGGIIHDIGYFKISPQGDKLALANWHAVNTFEVYDFNMMTGAVTHNQTISRPTAASDVYPYGVEFSNDGRYLYFTCCATKKAGYIFKKDLNTSALPILLGNSPAISLPNGKDDPRFGCSALQMTPDKSRIIIAMDGFSKLWAIENPDSPSASVNQNYLTLPSVCHMGLPTLVENSNCEDDCNCSSGCSGCNKDSEKQNEELIERAKEKFNTIKSDNDCLDPFKGDCEKNAIESQSNLEPCFSFHWGEGADDQIEEHDTEVFYLTVCNNYNDIVFNGLRITKVSLTPNIHPLEKIQIVPDRFISLDCLEPCTCQTREFAMITRANDTAGPYELEVEYCYEEIVIAKSGGSGVAKFQIKITED